MVPAARTPPLGAGLGARLLVVALAVRGVGGLAPPAPPAAASAAAAPRPRLRFPGVDAASFAHPKDVRSVERVRRLPGLEAAVRRASRIVDEVVAVDNLANAVRVGPRQLPGVHDLLLEACEVLDMDEVPELFVRQQPVPNAYTLAVRGGKPFIMLHTSLVDLLTPAELQSVIAHELGHLKCEHGVYLTAGNLVLAAVDMLGRGALEFATAPLSAALLDWQRAAEFTCDRAALLVAQDVSVVGSALLKLTGGSVKLAEELDVQAFLEQADRYEEAARAPLGRLLTRSMEAGGLTHPVPVMRAKELLKWEQGAQYHGILARGVALREAAGAECGAAA